MNVRCCFPRCTCNWNVFYVHMWGMYTTYLKYFSLPSPPLAGTGRQQSSAPWRRGIVPRLCPLCPPPGGSLKASSRSTWCTCTGGRTAATCSATSRAATPRCTPVSQPALPWWRCSPSTDILGLASLFHTITHTHNMYTCNLYNTVTWFINSNTITWFVSIYTITWFITTNTTTPTHQLSV